MVLLIDIMSEEDTSQKEISELDMLRVFSLTLSNAVFVTVTLKSVLTASYHVDLSAEFCRCSTKLP